MRSASQIQSAHPHVSSEEMLLNYATRHGTNVKQRVERCCLCHHAISWNDIRGVGFYKQE
jgi:hypothetical protein